MIRSRRTLVALLALALAACVIVALFLFVSDEPESGAAAEAGGALPLQPAVEPETVLGDELARVSTSRRGATWLTPPLRS